MAVLRALWRLLDHHQRRQLAGLQLLSIAMALSTVGGVAAVLPFFATLADPNAIEHSAILRIAGQWLHPSSRGSFVVSLGIVFAVAVLLANAVNLCGFLAINRFALRVGDGLYVRLFDAYLHCGYEFHARSNSAALAARVLESARVASGILQQALVLVTNLVIIVAVAAAVVVLNPLVALGAVFGLGAGYAALYAIARRQLQRNGQLESRYYSARTRTAHEALAAIKEVLIAQASDFFTRRFAQQSRAISTAGFSTLAIAQSPRYVLECCTVACLVSVALYLRSRADATGPWMAQLSFVGFAAYRLLPALQQVFAAVAKIRADGAGFAGIEIDLARARPERSPQQGSDPQRAWRGRPRRDITLSEVSYSHAPDRPAAIRGVSMVIPAGAIVGFTGANGSGKTTLLDMVGGLLLPQAGYVEVDGVRLEAANRVAWQSTIAYVPQQPFVFDATLGENVACGIAPASIDRERLETAIRLARLSDYVAGLPQGDAEPLGERGCPLSGGQRQRLAIARALYRDASLLILDEATSGLDASAEREIVETLARLRPGRTIVMVAHRTGALRHCDLIFELCNGCVVNCSTQARLVPTQARATHLR